MATCDRCGRDFASRNKLFKHLKNPLGCAEADGPAAPAATTGDAAPAAAGTEAASTAAADGGLELAQLVARLTAEQGGVLQAAYAGELLSRYHGGLLRRYQRTLGAAGAAAGAQDAGSWLAALVPAHPTLLSLERVGGDLQLKCDDALAASTAHAAETAGQPALVDAQAAATAAARLRSNICSKAANCKEATAEGWIPVPWLVRAVEKRLAAYVLLAPRADLARAADPGRFGMPTATEEQLARRHFRRRRGGASWATLTAHFRAFALAEAASSRALWEWSEDGPDWQQRYTAQKQKAPEEAEAYAVGSCFKSHLRLGSRAEQADDGPSAAASSAAAVDGSAAGADSRAALLDPLSLSPGQTTLLVVAGQAPRGRIGGAVSLELQLCARHHDVSGSLVPLSPGLWALRDCEDSGPTSVQLASFLAEVRGRCAAVRRPPLRLVSTTPTGGAAEPAAATSAIASLVQERLGGQREVFSLEPEGLYPENVPARLPYHKPTAVVGFAVALAAALGKAGFDHDTTTAAAARRHKLVAIEALSPHTADPSGRLILAREEAAVDLPSMSTLCSSKFWRTWTHRPHQFEGCLDLHLATVGVNVARYVALSRNKTDAKATGADGAGAGTTSPPATKELRLLDPCCGSGTIAAAAIGAGGWGSILATELRPEWVEHAKTNLQTLSPSDRNEHPPAAKRARVELQDDSGGGSLLQQHPGCPETAWQVEQHDATHAFDSSCEFDAVVANPPWGKRIGQGTDSSPAIVRSLLRQFPGAVHVIFCPSLAGCIKDMSSRGGEAAEAAGEAAAEEGWEVLHEVKVGGKTSMYVLVRRADE